MKGEKLTRQRDFMGLVRENTVLRHVAQNAASLLDLMHEFEDQPVIWSGAMNDLQRSINDLKEIIRPKTSAIYNDDGTLREFKEDKR